MISSLADSTLQVVGLRWNVANLELSRPLVTSTARYEQRSVLLLRVDLRVDGEAVCGYGEAAPLEGWSDESIADCEQALHHLELPRDEFQFPALETPRELARAIQSLFGVEDLATLRFGLELAVLDGLSRHFEMPLYTFLAKGADEVVDQVCLQYTLGVTSLEETMESVRRAVERGFGCVKLKVGVEAIGIDVEKIAAIRRNFPDVAIRLDANGAYDFDAARRLLEVIADLDVDLVEQPLDRCDVEGLAKLSDLELVDIAADESAIPSSRAHTLVETKAVDALVLKPTALGGLLAALSIVDEARRREMRVVLSTLIESAVGRRAVAHLAACRPRLSGPHGLATGQWFADDVVPEPDVIKEGSMHLGHNPGLGFVPRQENTPASRWRGGRC